MFEFVKDDSIIEVADRDKWGDFATEIHLVWSQFPSAMANCEMFEFEGDGFGPDGRPRIKIQLPGLDWLVDNPSPEKFPFFPSRQTRDKLILPRYLDLVLYQVHKRCPKTNPAFALKCNYFITQANHERVQVLIYGLRTKIPFCVIDHS